MQREKANSYPSVNSLRVGDVVVPQGEDVTVHSWDDLYAFLGVGLDFIPGGTALTIGAAVSYRWTRMEKMDYSLILMDPATGERFRFDMESEEEFSGSLDGATWGVYCRYMF